MMSKAVESHTKTPTPRRRPALLLLLSLALQLQLTTAAKASSTLAHRHPRLAFHPRRSSSSSSNSNSSSSSSSSSTLTLASSRRTMASSSSSPTVRTVGLRRKKSPVEVGEYNNPLLQSKDDDDEPSLDELRAQLGPIGYFVSNSVELFVVTVGSYISGGLMGYVGGGAMGIPSTLFGKEMGNIAARFSALNARAFASCKSWATLSAAFTGFHKLSWLVRGGVEDRWNSVWGSFMTGAYLNRDKGSWQEMVRGGATYAGFTLVLDKFLAGPTSSSRMDRELVYTDIPIDD